jgi:serine/threonine protein kinase/Tfp pilus assembly protein PilF
MGRASDVFPKGYTIIRKIGEGGTSEVFLAGADGHSQPVAVKLFSGPSASDLVERELEIAGRIKFPGIVRIHRSGRTTDGRYFVQTEYCPGPTLDNLAGSISEDKLLSILSAVSASLNVLHQAGYTHNDIKPANIFSPTGFDNDDFPINRLHYLKLGDFSLARRYDYDDTASVTGTVGYMSPEMILKKRIAPASDLFSLGVTAYYLACGKPPFAFDTDNPLEINARITEGERPCLCGPAASFSEDAAKLIKSLLEIDPDSRPSSAFELLESLAKAGSPYPFRKAIRPRHLLWGWEKIDSTTLIVLFGKGSFSPGHLGFIQRVTSYDPAHMRILLECNFKAGNFARLDGCWGWKNESADSIEWSRRQMRFSLRPLCGRPVSLKHLALALAIVGNGAEVEMVADIFSADEKCLLDQWYSIPEGRRAALLHSLDSVMAPSTRKILSRRLVRIYEKSESRRDLVGKLMFNAERYTDAVEYLTAAAEGYIAGNRHDDSLPLLDIALEAAGKLDNQTLRADVLIRKARLLKDLGRLQPAEDGYNRVIDLARQNDLKGIAARAYKDIGDLYKAKSDYNAGIEALNHALELYRDLNDQLELSHTLNNLGNIQWVAGQLDQALEHYHEALKIQTELKSDRDIASSLSNIGSIYSMRGQYNEGVSFLDRSLAIKERLGDKRELARTWNNLGAAQFLAGRINQAINAYIRSLEYNRETGDRHEQLLNIENLAEVMIQAGRLNKALEYLKEGTKLAEEEDVNFHKSDLMRLTGQLLRRMGYYDDAEAKLNRALKIAKKTDNKGLRLVCTENIARLYFAIGETSTAKEYISMAVRLAESLGEKNALFHLSLMQFEISGDVKLYEKAEEFAKDLNSRREMALLNLVLLEQNNKRNVNKGSEKYLTGAGRFFNDETEDIDRARFGLAVGKYHFLIREEEKAVKQLEKSLDLAVSYGLLPEQWQISSLLSEIAFAGGDFETSFDYAQQTLDVLKKISVKVRDSQRLGRLYNDERIIELLGRVKSLQSVLGHKRGAATDSP